MPDLANQRLPSSIPEDAINKPWRPLPSGRLTPTHARRLLLVTIPVVLAAAAWLGALNEAAAIVILSWMYNDLAAADENWYIRNLMNALAFVCFSSGATRVACDGAHSLNPTAYIWLAIIGCTIVSTLQLQDLYDQEGDAVRGRSTAPLVLGDWVARWTVAIPVCIWAVVCPLFWRVGWLGFVAPVGLGGLVAGRVLMIRNVKGDRMTFRFWCLWTMGLYLLPLVKEFSALTLV